MESPFASLMISVILKAAIIIIALQIALNKTKSLSGAAGTWATKAGTAAFGVALGGAALAGRHTVGRAAKGFRDSDAGKRFVAKTGVAGEYLDRGLGAMAGGTMDIRGIPGMDKAGLGRPANKGGYDKYLSEQVKRKEDLGKRLKGVSGGESQKEINPATGKYKLDELRSETPKEGINPATGRTFKYEHEQKILEQEKRDQANVKKGDDVQEKYIKRLEKGGKRTWAQANRQAAKNLRKKKSPIEEFFETEEGKKMIEKKAGEKTSAEEPETPKEGTQKE